MKRLIGCLIIALCLTLGLSMLTGCKKDDGIPDGMQLVVGSESLGYYFYAPEEWIVANQGGIAATYVSKLDTTSATFTEAKKPEVTVSEYFASEVARLPFDVTVTVENERCLFGNAQDAYRFVYTYEYKDMPVRCMQIFVFNGDSFYIFTFTSYDREKSEGVTYYDYYLEKLTKIIEQFKFVEKVEGDAAKQEYEKDDDGYLLISDRDICGFDMYVPESYSVDFASGIVSASKDNGTSVNVSKATYTNVYLEDYWKTRKEALERLADKVTDENGDEVSTFKEIETDKPVTLDGAKWAFSYEYSYALDGVKYHVCQVFMVDNANGYVFTFTSLEENYASDLGECTSILGKLRI